jgi:hypothetical protein
VRKQSLLAFLVFAVGAPTLEQQVKVHVHTVAAAQQDAPVRVIAVILWPDRPQPLNPNIVGVVLENVSTTPVVSVELSSETAAPHECSSHRRTFTAASGPDAASVYIEPGTKVQHWTGVANPHVVVSASLWLKSRYLQAQIGVSQVDFSDGTSWKRWEQRTQERGVFDLDLLRADSVKCSAWQWPEELDSAIEKWNDPGSGRLQGIADVRLFSRGHSPNDLRNGAERENEETASYFYDCELQLHADAAHCGPPRLLEQAASAR